MASLLDFAKKLRDSLDQDKSQAGFQLAKGGLGNQIKNTLNQSAQGYKIAGNALFNGARQVDNRIRVNPITNSAVNFGSGIAKATGVPKMAGSILPALRYNIENVAINSGLSPSTPQYRQFVGQQANQSANTFRQGTTDLALTLGSVYTPALRALRVAPAGVRAIQAGRPLAATIGGAIGGVGAKLSGQDWAEGAGRGAVEGLKSNLLAGSTGPILGKLIPKGSNFVNNRIVPAGLNVAQGIGMDKVLGYQTDPTSIAIDLVMGFAGGKNQFQIKSSEVDQLDKLWKKSKGDVDDFIKRANADVTWVGGDKTKAWKLYLQKKLRAGDIAVSDWTKKAMSAKAPGFIDPSAKVGGEAPKVEPQIKMSSGGNIYIKTGKDEVVKGIPKTVQNDIYEASQGNIPRPDRRLKANTWLNKKGLSMEADGTIRVSSTQATAPKGKIQVTKTQSQDFKFNVGGGVQTVRSEVTPEGRRLRIVDTTPNATKIPLTSKQAVTLGVDPTFNPKQSTSPRLPTPDENYAAQANIGSYDETGNKANVFDQVRGLPDDLQRRFKDFVNGRSAIKFDGETQAKNFTQYDDRGIEGFRAIQDGDTSEFGKQLRSFFDTKRNEVEASGINVNYKQDYLPQLWQESQQTVERAFRRIGLKPSFSMENIFKSYDEGIKAGLTPRFTKVSDLVNWYEQTANKAILNKQFFDGLLADGYLASGKNVPPGWRMINPESFPKMTSNFEGTEITGNYYAPPELAKVINEYLSPNDGALNKVANFMSGAKSRVLTGGIPKTAINAHGFNIWARSVLSEKNPVSALLRTGGWLVRPGKATKYLETNAQDAQRFARAGMTINPPTDYKRIVTNGIDDPKFWSKIKGGAQKYDDWFAEPLFNQVIPAVKVHYAKGLSDDLIKRGVSAVDADRQAAKAANEMFGGINTDEIARSKQFQDIMRVFFLAPDWLETTARQTGKTANAVFNPKTWGKAEQLQYRRFATNFAGAVILANVINKVSSGNYLWQNEPGHEFEIDTGQYDGNGKKIYFRPFGTAVDGFRLPFEIAMGIAKGDFSKPIRTIANRMNPVASAGMHIIGNQDYLGRPLYGKDKYGNEIPALQGALNVGGEVANIVGIPNNIRVLYDTPTKGLSPVEAVSQALELPLRFSGGAYTPKQKTRLAEQKQMGMNGKDVYNFNQSMKDAKYMGSSEQDKYWQLFKQDAGLAEQYKSSRQRADAISKQEKRLTGEGPQLGILDQIKQSIGISKASASEPTNTVENTFTYMDGDTVKTIDLSFTPTPPKLTGNKELDKKLISAYKGDITKKKNDIVALYEQGQISADQAEQMINELDAQAKKNGAGSTKKPKKATIKGSAVKVSVPKAQSVSPIRIRKGSLSSINLPKVNTKPPKSNKLRLTTNTSYKPRAIKAPGIQVRF